MVIGDEAVELTNVSLTSIWHYCRVARHPVMVWSHHLFSVMVEEMVFVVFDYQEMVMKPLPYCWMRWLLNQRQPHPKRLLILWPDEMVMVMVMNAVHPPLHQCYWKAASSRLP